MSDKLTSNIQNRLAKPSEIVSAQRVINGNKMIETCKNSAGQVSKVSVFIDRNADGKFDASEAVSVKYINVASRSQQSVEYRDTNGDGFSDEIVQSDWTGNETVEKESPDNFHGKNHRMDFKYGFKWDSESPAIVYGKE